ncbi:MAG TPA: SigB/SigF/SigG family RNA polymerase sigma factor [Sporichthyaceae bacterium]
MTTAATLAAPRPAPSVEATDLELFRALRDLPPEERPAVQDILVERYSGLVRWLAARYAGPAIDVEDLRQVGYVGLVLAVQRFDPERGTQFAAFARPTVQGEIRRYFRDKRRWIQLPRRLQEIKADIRQATESLTHDLGRAPTMPELADVLGVDTDVVLEAFTADDVYAPVSLETPLRFDGEDSYTVCDVLGVDDRRFQLLTDCTSLLPLLDGLTDRERRLLHLRFFEDRTQSEIGEELGVSQMHVSRLLTKVLAQLREQLGRD